MISNIFSGSSTQRDQHEIKETFLCLRKCGRDGKKTRVKGYKTFTLREAQDDTSIKSHHHFSLRQRLVEGTGRKRRHLVPYPTSQILHWVNKTHPGPSCLRNAAG